MQVHSRCHTRSVRLHVNKDCESLLFILHMQGITKGLTGLCSTMILGAQ